MQITKNQRSMESQNIVKTLNNFDEHFTIQRTAEVVEFINSRIPLFLVSYLKNCNVNLF